jgi:hypothetical protein
MRTHLIVLTGALGMLAATTVMAVADDKPRLSDPSINPGQTQSFRIVQGEVLKMEGNTYLVRDETGQEIRLTINKDSKVDKAFEVGDRIVAQVSDQGIVTLINKSDAQTAPAPGTEQKGLGQKRESGSSDAPRNPFGSVNKPNKPPTGQ